MKKIASNELMSKIAAFAEDNKLRASYEAGVVNHAILNGVDPETANVIAKKASAQFCAKEDAAFKRREALKVAFLSSLRS